MLRITEAEPEQTEPLTRKAFSLRGNSTALEGLEESGKEHQSIISSLLIGSAVAGIRLKLYKLAIITKSMEYTLPTAVILETILKSKQRNIFQALQLLCNAPR